MYLPARGGGLTLEGVNAWILSFTWLSFLVGGVIQYESFVNIKNNRKKIIAKTVMVFGLLASFGAIYNQYYS